jgi:putative membrane protein
MLQTLPLAILLAGTGPALLAQQSSEHDPSVGSGGQGASPASLTLAPEDQEFLYQAYSMNKAEMEAGRLAMQKGTTPQVKNYGRTMMGDHSLALTELAQVAHRERLSMPSQLRRDQQQVVDLLSGLSGQQFDQRFLDHMVSGHKKAIDAFENEVKSGRDAGLKRYAEKELITLKAHRDIAQFDENHPGAR